MALIKSRFMTSLFLGKMLMTVDLSLLITVFRKLLFC